MKRGSGAAALRNFQVAPASCRSAAWAVSQRAPSSLRRPASGGIGEVGIVRREGQQFEQAGVARHQPG